MSHVNPEHKNVLYLDYCHLLRQCGGDHGRRVMRACQSSSLIHPNHSGGRFHRLLSELARSTYEQLGFVQS